MSFLWPVSQSVAFTSLQYILVFYPGPVFGVCTLVRGFGRLIVIIPPKNIIIEIVIITAVQKCNVYGQEYKTCVVITRTLHIHEVTSNKRNVNLTIDHVIRYIDYHRSRQLCMNCNTTYSCMFTFYLISPVFPSQPTRKVNHAQVLA